MSLGGREVHMIDTSASHDRDVRFLRDETRLLLGFRVNLKKRKKNKNKKEK